MRIHFGSLAFNNGFQIKMRLYKSAYWVEHIERSVERVDGVGWLWPWRGVGRGEVCFWFFVLRLKARPRKLLLRQIANAIYDEPIRN